MDIEINFNLKQRIVLRRFIQGLIVLVIFLMAISDISHENDFFWQLKMGEAIWEHHVFPIHDPFNFSNPGAVWTLEEWTMGVLFYALFTHFGPGVLIFLKAAVMAATFTLFLLLFNRRKVNLYLSFFVLLLAAMVNTRGVWVVFPSIFEYLFLVSTFFILEYFRKITAKTVIILGVFSWIWANSHASFFILTLILFAYAFGGLAAEKLKKRFLSYEPAGWVPDRAARIKLALAGIISLLTPLATPNGYWTFIYPFRITLGKFTPYVSEYQKYWQVWNWDFSDFVHGFTFTLIVIVVCLFLFSAKKLNPIDLILAAIFIGLALSAVRHVAIFALVALFLVSKYISVWFGEYRGIFRRSLLKDVILILFIISFIYYYKTNVVQFGLKLKEDEYPHDAAKFVNENKIPPNMFNHYNYGGYLIWKMPDYKVFIDGRLEMYEGQVGQDYLTILDAGHGWREVLAKYNINFTLTYATDPIVGRLMNDSSWRLVQASGRYAVFVKNAAQNAQIVEKYWSYDKEEEFRQAYNRFAAENLNNLGIGEIKKRDFLTAIDYFKQAVQLAPNLVVARFNLAQAYMNVGWWDRAREEYLAVLKIDPQNREVQKNLERVEKLKELSQKQPPIL